MGEVKEKVTVRLEPELLAAAKERPGSLTSVFEDALRAWLGLAEVDPFEEVRTLTPGWRTWSGASPSLKGWPALDEGQVDAMAREIRAAKELALRETKRADRAEFLAAQLYTAVKGMPEVENLPELARAMEVYEEWEREE